MALMLCHSGTHQTETVLFPYSCHSAILMSSWCTQTTIWTWLLYLPPPQCASQPHWLTVAHAQHPVHHHLMKRKYCKMNCCSWLNMAIKMLWLILSSCSELQLECPQTTEPFVATFVPTFVPTFLSTLLMLSTGRSVYGTGILCSLVLQAKRVGGGDQGTRLYLQVNALRM